MSLKLACLACGQGNRVPEGRLRASPKCGKCGVLLVPQAPIDVSLDVLQKAERIDDGLVRRTWVEAGRGFA
ncbi:hypothetical protein [Ruegeria arenilitoris]|uniref:hypothetical protein n=1 Tax=Ruegeria arenilitoris TaxID=1173585 RepID=UPI003464AF59